MCLLLLIPYPRTIRWFSTSINRESFSVVTYQSSFVAGASMIYYRPEANNGDTPNVNSTLDVDEERCNWDELCSYSTLELTTGGNELSDNDFRFAGGEMKSKDFKCGEGFAAVAFENAKAAEDR